MTTATNDKQSIMRVGTVKSDRMSKTIVVRVDRRVMHPIYKMFVKRFTTLVAHDENDEARVGDKVEVVFARPLSKRKRWRLVRVVDAVGAPDAEGGAA